MSNDNNSLAVTVGKPKVGGSVYRAPLGTTIPTDAVTALAAAFKCLGYISDEGITNTDSRTVETIKAWGGDPVLNVLTEKQDTWKMKLIEAMNLDVLKTVYGDSNVTGALATGAAVSVNATGDTPHIYIIEMVYNNSTVKRVVLPVATLTELEDIIYVDGEAVGYGITLSCVADSSGNTHYEYIKSAS